VPFVACLATPPAGWLLGLSPLLRGQERGLSILPQPQRFKFSPFNRQAAGCLELSDACTVTEGAPLRAPPAGAFTLSLPDGAASSSSSSRRVRDCPLAAGSERERRGWMAAIAAARGRPARALPDEAVLVQLASLTRSVAAEGGASLALRIQKRLAERHAGDADLEALLARVPGASQMVHALLAALRTACEADEDEAGALRQRGAVLAAKLSVLLRCKLVDAAALAQTAHALTHAAELAVAKQARELPRDHPPARDLPSWPPL
jgi:hypothetical protein